MKNTTSKVDLDDKKMKINWFILNKIVLGTVQGDQFLYISLKLDYKFNFQLLQCFSLEFSIRLHPILYHPFAFIYAFHE